MNGDAMDKKLYAHEVGRYKRKVKLLEEELDRKRQEIEAWRESFYLLQSLVDLIVAEVGTVVIHQDALAEAMNWDLTNTDAEWNEEEQTITLRPFKGEATE